jgi:hypothetical protein
MTPLPKLRPRSVDMTPEAIDQRLRDVSKLTYLCLTLASAKRLGTVSEIRAREQALSTPKRVRDGSDPQIAQSDAD